MSDSVTMNNRLVRLLKWVIRVVVSVWVATIFFCSPGVSGYYRADFPDMVYGKAYRPFVTRALFPVVVRVVSQAIPPGLESVVERSALGSRIISSKYFKEGPKWQMPFLREYLVAYLLTIGCLILLGLTMEALWKILLRPSTPHAYLFGTLGLAALPICFEYYSHIYDFPSLLFYTVCLYLMASRRWKSYFAVFALSCLSKETTVLLIAVFALYFVKCEASERRTYWRFISIQVLVFLVTRGGIAWIFRNNPGSLVEFHLLDHNLRVLTTPWSVQALVAWGIIVGLFFKDFAQKPWLLRVAAGMIVPLLALTFFFGFLDELRDYYEVYVPVLALVSYSFCALLRCPIETIAPTSPSGVGRIRVAPEVEK